MANMLPWYPEKPVRLASARQFQNSIAESVKIVIEHYIKEFDLQDEFEIHKFAIDHVDGSHMFFPGFDRNPESLMGIEGVNVLWVEQAETVGSEMEKVIPTFIRTPGIELWFSWNASKRNQWCWQRFKEHQRSTDVVAHVNYNDNPWWFVHCSACMERYPWDEAGGACAKCGGEKLPGLVEFERERQAIEVGEPDRYEHVYLGVPDDGDASRQVLTYSMVQACVRAYELGLYGDLAEAPVTDMGFDVAEGGRDKCAQVIRRGPCIEFVDQWPGVAGDLSVAARRVVQNAEDYESTSDRNIWRLYYDASSPMRREFTALGQKSRPVAFGGVVGGPDRMYERKRPNKEVFARRNIQMGDSLRLRANRTVRLLKAHDEGRTLGDDEISPARALFINPKIKHLEAFKSDLTQPIRRRNPTTGKWELDKRGGDENAESPDRFDAVCLAYARDSDHGLRAR